MDPLNIFCDQVHCADVTGGGLLPDARCDHLSRPVSEEFCEAGACVSDQWLVGEWGPVSYQMMVTRLSHLPVTVHRPLWSRSGPQEGHVSGSV